MVGYTTVAGVVSVIDTGATATVVSGTGAPAAAVAVVVSVASAPAPALVGSSVVVVVVTGIITGADAEVAMVGVAVPLRTLGEGATTDLSDSGRSASFSFCFSYEGRWRGGDGWREVVLDERREVEIDDIE